MTLPCNWSAPKKCTPSIKNIASKNKSTDILSFSYYPNLKPGQTIKPTSEEERNLGDIIMCPEYVMNDLARWGQSFEHRLKVLLIHGLSSAWL